MDEESEIGKFRAQIDEIDTALLQLIAKRLEVALEIAKIKQDAGTFNDEERIRGILERIKADAEEIGLSGEDMKKIWKELISYMIREQMEKHPY